MAPKAKPKAKGKAKAEAKGKAETAEPKATASTGAPAAGSATAAVRQSKLDASAASTAEESTASASAGASSSAGASATATPAAAAPIAAVEVVASAPESDAASALAAEEAPASAMVVAASQAKPEGAGSVGGDVEADDEGKAAGDPESGVELKVDDKEVDLSDIPDPWVSVADEAALVKIRKEDWNTIELGDGEPGSDAPTHLAAKDADLVILEPSKAHRLALISADFSGNGFANVAALGGPMWLRALSLANNPLESLVGLSEFFPRLLSLDVSFVEISGIEDAWEALAACPRLRRLNLEGCSLASFDDMKPMPKLLALEAMDNALESMEEIEALRERCPNLQQLDLRENDVVNEGNYMKKVKALFPKLASLDTNSTKAYVAKGQDEAYKDVVGMNKDINAVDGMWKNEGCSCIEGNACLEPETCKDWKNREAVSAAARKRKGLRDDTGKLCL